MSCDCFSPSFSLKPHSERTQQKAVPQYWMLRWHTLCCVLWCFSVSTIHLFCLETLKSVFNYVIYISLTVPFLFALGFQHYVFTNNTQKDLILANKA